MKGSSPTKDWARLTRPPVIVFAPVSSSVIFHGSLALLCTLTWLVDRSIVTSLWCRK